MLSANTSWNYYCSNVAYAFLSHVNMEMDSDEKPFDLYLLGLNSGSHLLITKDFQCNAVNPFTTVVTRDTDFDIVSAIF